MAQRCTWCPGLEQAEPMGGAVLLGSHCSAAPSPPPAPGPQGGPESHVSPRGAVAGATECSFPLTSSQSAFWLWSVLGVPFRGFLATEQGHPPPGVPLFTSVPFLAGLCPLSPVLPSGLEPLRRLVFSAWDPSPECQDHSPSFNLFFPFQNTEVFFF